MSASQRHRAESSRPASPAARAAAKQSPAAWPRRGGEARVPRRLQRQRGILGQQRHMRVHGRIGGQGATQAVTADPALAAGLLDHRQCRGRFQAEALRQGQRLGGTGQVDGGQQVVDELGACTVTWALADAKQPRGQVLQQALPALEDRVRAGHHQAHRAVARAGGAAGHRCVDAVHVAGSQREGTFFDRLRREGRAQHHRRAWRQAMDRAAFAEQRLLRLRRVDHRHDQQFAVVCHHRRVGAHRGAM